jgi:hypothetical protein
MFTVILQCHYICGNFGNIFAAFYQQSLLSGRAAMRKVLMLLVLLALVVLGAMPTLAQDARTITITETRINESYRVTNPRRAAVSNRVVDLQAGQAVISATLTYRRTTYNVVSTYTPRVENGRIYWTLVSATANGEPASQELIAQINTSLSTSWRNYVRGEAGNGRVTAITVNDTEITITVQR